MDPLNKTDNIIDQAMIQAAGLGTRLRPLTLNTPKPLMPIAGSSFLDLALDTLLVNGVKKVAINTHYLADQIHRHIAARQTKDMKQRPGREIGAGLENELDIHLSYEEKLLDTGGGIKKACELLDPSKPLFCLSADWAWEDRTKSPYFQDLINMWDDQKMDILMLLVPKSAMRFTSSSGDIDLHADGRASLSVDKSGKFMWASVRIFHPRVFVNSPLGPFSFLEPIKRAQENGRLYGLAMPEKIAL